MQNHKMLSRLFATAIVSLAAVSAQAADLTGNAAANAGSPTSAPGAGIAPGALNSAPGAANAAPEAPSPSAYADDAMITTMVKTALVEDKQVKSLKINVTTEQGVVKMSGTVPSVEVGKRVLQLAAGVQGVKDIKNGLKVKKG
ncbi:MAG: BON domain-containing protein [Oxalobacteraceae bacterium]